MNAQHVLPPQYLALSEGKIVAMTNWRGNRRRILSTTLHRGYQCVRVVRNGKRERMMVHQVICTAFNGQRPSPNHEVRHINGNPMDNRASNLAWGTRKENALDRERHGHTSRGAKHSLAIKAGKASGGAA